MDIQVPPVICGEFFFRDGTLSVNVGGDLKRHAPASVSDLKPLRRGTAPKDQVAHFYEAQPIHYGLQRSKDKNTAKARLQQALSQGKLNVPPHIVDMEAQMKTEYASSVRKVGTASAKAGPEVKGWEADGGGKAKGKKRKQDDEEESAVANKKTKITVKIGDMEVSIDQATIEAATKKTTKANSKEAETSATKRTSAKDNAGATVKPAKSTKSKSNYQEGNKLAPKTKTPKAKPQWKANQPDKLPTRTAKLKGLNAVKQDIPKTPASKTKAEPKPKATPKSKAESCTKPEPKVKTEPKIKKEINVKPAKTPKKEPKIKGELDVYGDALMSDAPPASNSARNVTGIYDISCVQLKEQLPERAGNLRMLLCVDDENQPSRTWGGFEPAMKFGVFRLAEDYAGPNVPHATEWRARDSSQGGKMRFGKGCVGELEFVGRDEIMSVVYDLFNEAVMFSGRRRPGPLWCGKAAWKFKEEWGGFVREAYGR